MSQDRTVIFVKVDVEKALRASKRLSQNLFLKEVSFSKGVLRGEWRKVMGVRGLMEIEDYKKGLFTSYGLDPNRIGNATNTSDALISDQQKTIADQARAIEALKAENEALAKATPPEEVKQKKKTETSKTEEA